MYFDQLLVAACQVHVVYFDQLLGAAHYIHLISNHATKRVSKHCLRPVRFRAEVNSCVHCHETTLKSSCFNLDISSKEGNITIAPIQHNYYQHPGKNIQIMLYFKDILNINYCI